MSTSYRNIREYSAYCFDHLELLVSCTVTQGLRMVKGRFRFFQLTQANVALVGALVGLHERFVDEQGLLTVEKRFFVFFDLDIRGGTVRQDRFIFDKIYKILKPRVYT